MSSKTYGGIVGENEEDIRKIILAERSKDSSFRAISNILKGKFGLKTSHQTISNYWKNVMNGDSLDKMKNSVEKRAYKSDSDVLIPPVLDQKGLARIEAKDSDFITVDTIREYALLLCYSNMKAFIEGKERLKSEYVRYLRDVESIIKNSRSA